MAVKNFNDSEKQKLIQIISQGSQVLGEIDDLRSGLRDTVKAVAEELELKPALINKAIWGRRGNNLRSTLTSNTTAYKCR